MHTPAESAQPIIATIDIDGVPRLVSVRVSYDGVEYIGRIWFTEDRPNGQRVPDRSMVPGRTKEEVLERARALGPEELVARYRRAVANKRRYLLLRQTTEDILAKVRYLNQVTISMRAGLIDMDGAAQEIDLTEQQLHELVRRLRTSAGIEDQS